jgi:hypothetical protein
MADGLVAVGVVFGMLAAPLACGGRSLVHEGYGDGDASSGAEAGGTSSGAGGIGGASGSSATGGSATGGSATGGSATGGSATGGVPTRGCDPTGHVIDTPSGAKLVPDCDGWLEGFTNDFGVSGSWYAFGDQYPGLNRSKCTEFGLHTPEQCSFVSTPPPPPSLGFPQRVAGEMCTSGETAMILPCTPGLMTAGCPALDYANMTGAGIAFDFNAAKSEDGGARNSWNPLDFGFIGFSFEVDVVPSLALRIEISQKLTTAEAEAVGLPPGSTTDDHPDGSPYWGASSTYPASPVTRGLNRVLWSEIRPPRTNYVFDAARILSLAFHVIADVSARKQYSFCIKNLTLLRE